MKRPLCVLSFFFGLFIVTGTAEALPIATCSARPVVCVQTIVSDHAHFSSAYAPTWLPRFKQRINPNGYIYVDGEPGGQPFVVNVGDSIDNLLTITIATSMTRICGSAICRDEWGSLHAYRQIGQNQYEIVALKRSGLSPNQLLRIAKSLQPA